MAQNVTACERAREKEFSKLETQNTTPFMWKRAALLDFDDTRIAKWMPIKTSDAQSSAHTADRPTNKSDEQIFNVI